MFSVFVSSSKSQMRVSRIVDHVFQDGAEAQRRRIDVGLGLLGELDALRVAAALEIEHALRAPAVLVVADQGAVGIGGQRRLAGAGQPEEQRDVAVAADVGRAVHRHHALSRQVVVERGEHRLLHLAGVVAAADEDDAFRKVDGDHGLAAHAVALGVGLERGQAEDGEIRHVMGKLGAIGSDQQRADEQRMPGELGEDACLDPVFRIGAAIEVLGVELLALGVCKEILVKQIELGRRQLAVLVPPDRFFGVLVAHHEFVLRAAAGVDAGLSAQRAAFDDLRLAVLDRVLVKGFCGEVPVNGSQVGKAEFVGAMGAVSQTCFLHGAFSPDEPALSAGNLYPTDSGRAVRARPHACK